MTEQGPTCQIHKKYYWINCQNPALPVDPEGLCILHSQDKSKDPVAFREVLRDRWKQEDAEFYDFRGVFFPGPFYPQEFFGSIEFVKPADFSMATFMKVAFFPEATFRGPANFSNAFFTESAVFSKATFTNWASFLGAIFTEASFNSATFTEWVNFYSANLKLADFRWATFSGEAIFVAIHPPQEKRWERGPFEGRFEGLRLGPKALIRFEDLSLAMVRFGGTDLRYARFFKVIWHRLRGRNAVYDETFLKKEKNYDQVEELYRHLKLNYEREGDLKKAGDFHYGEMEMYRQADYLRRWFSWYFLYWASSGYGEKPLRAFCVLFGLLAILTVLFGWADSKLIKGWSLDGIIDSILYTLQQGTFQRPEWYKPANSWGKFLATITLILIPGQAALFLLALRNRLGRRR